MEVVIFRYSFTIISSITLRTWLNSYRYFVVVWTANNPLSIEVILFNSVQVGVVRVHVQRHQYPYILYRKVLVHLHVNKTKIHMKGFALGLLWNRDEMQLGNHLLRPKIGQPRSFQRWALPSGGAIHCGIKASCSWQSAEKTIRKGLCQWLALSVCLRRALKGSTGKFIYLR